MGGKSGTWAGFLRKGNSQARAYSTSKHSCKFGKEAYLFLFYHYSHWKNMLDSGMLLSKNICTKLLISHWGSEWALIHIPNYKFT